MRRLSLVLLALTSLTLFGCAALRDAFSITSTAIDFPSGDHRGIDISAFKFVTA